MTTHAVGLAVCAHSQIFLYYASEAWISTDRLEEHNRECERDLKHDSSWVLYYEKKRTRRKWQLFVRREPGGTQRNITNNNNRHKCALEFKRYSSIV